KETWTRATHRRSEASAPSSRREHKTVRQSRPWRETPDPAPRETAAAGRPSRVRAWRSIAVAPWSCAGAPNRNPFHPQRRLADTDRHTLTILAAGADLGVERQIAADHRDPMQVGRSVTDQHCAFQGRADLAVFDPIGLGALEYIFAGRDVDLATAEIRGKNAVLDR